MNKNQNTRLNANVVGAGLTRGHVSSVAHKFAQLTDVPAQNSRGITLVALIITVIVMLILVGVTVNIALNGGLFGMTKEAVKKTEIAAYKEKIDAIRINIIVEQISKGLADKEFMNRYEEELRKDKNFEGSEITREGETIILITKEGYKFIITEEETNYTGDTDAPETPETPKTPPSLTENDITYEPETWTNGSVMVSINKQIEGYTLKYQKNGGTLQDYSGAIEMTEKGTIDIQLIDSETNTVVRTVTANVNNIDRKAPTITASTTLSCVGYRVSLKLDDNAKDDTERPCITELGYKKDGGEVQWSQLGANQDLSNVEFSPNTAGTYYVYAKDMAGNITEESNAVKIEVLKEYDDADKSSGLLTENAGYVSDEKMAVIPKGFKIVTGTIDTGLVIQDKDGNEFVWIPVKVEKDDSPREIKSFYRSYWSNNTRGASLIGNTNYSEPYESGFAGEALQYYNMLGSVYKHGGFYIGRYEAGTTTQRTETTTGTTTTGTTKIVVKKGVYPYNYVGWGAAINDTSTVVYEEKNRGLGAYALSFQMYFGREDLGVTSTLCYGVQWDAMLDFIKDDNHIVTDSTNWGNYKPTSGNPSIQATGNDERYKAKNIYDVAGNVMEWNMEVYSDTKRERRGGGYPYVGSEHPASARDAADTTFCSSYVGFRVSLFVK